MNSQLEAKLKDNAKELIRRSGFAMTEAELAGLQVNDFGLGDVEKEGFEFYDILRSPRLRITLIVLVPNQTLPQHKHPSYGEESGKEETIRVLHGQAKIYIQGPKNNDNMLIPAGKEKHYTAMHEIVLDAGQQYTLKPNTEHWFQGGDQGTVALSFQNRVDETMNIFSDPASGGCPIKPTD